MLYWLSFLSPQGIRYSLLFAFKSPLEAELVIKGNSINKNSQTQTETGKNVWWVMNSHPKKSSSSYYYYLFSLLSQLLRQSIQNKSGSTVIFRFVALAKATMSMLRIPGTTTLNTPSTDWMVPMTSSGTIEEYKVENWGPIIIPTATAHKKTTTNKGRKMIDQLKKREYRDA